MAADAAAGETREQWRATLVWVDGKRGPTVEFSNKDEAEQFRSRWMVLKQFRTIDDVIVERVA